MRRAARSMSECRMKPRGKTGENYMNKLPTAHFAPFYSRGFSTASKTDPNLQKGRKKKKTLSRQR